MKMFPKFMLTMLCSNLTLGCFAGTSISKESVSKNEEKKETRVTYQASRQTDFCVVKGAAVIGCVAFTLYDLLSDSFSEEERKEQKAKKADTEFSGKHLEGACSKDDPKGAVIELSAKQIHALKEQFDNQGLTPDWWGSQKLIRFDYKHIFNASNKKNKHQGHYNPNNVFSKSQEKASTSFPSDWTPNKIMSKILESYRNYFRREYNSKVRSWISLGKTSEGLTIEIRFKTDRKGYPTGKVKTAFPRP